MITIKQNHHQEGNYSMMHEKATFYYSFLLKKTYKFDIKSDIDRRKKNPIPYKQLHNELKQVTSYLFSQRDQNARVHIAFRYNHWNPSNHNMQK